MEKNFKDIATLSKRKVNNILSGENTQNKIYDLIYSIPDILIQEAGNLITNYGTCKYLRQEMTRRGVTAQKYVKTYLKDIKACVASNTITDTEAIYYRTELFEVMSIFRKHRKIELLKMKSQSYIKTAIAYAEADIEYVNIVEDIVCFPADIGRDFIADSICDICTTYRSYKTIENILYVLAKYGCIFNDSQLQRIQSSASPHPRVNILNRFYGCQESILMEQHVDNNTEIKDNK